MRRSRVDVAFLLVWLLLALWAACATFYPDGNIDIWLHLRVGQEVSLRGVPHVDSWSATAAGRPFVAHEWLAGVLFENVAERAGGAGLVMLRVWIAALLALCLWLSAPRTQRDRPLTLVIAALVLLLVLPRAVARPHLFSLLFFALHVVALMAWRERRSWLALAWLPLLVALWANLHGAFVLGPALLLAVAGAALLGVRFPRLRGDGDAADYAHASAPLVVAVVSLLFGLLNPYGWQLYAFALEMAFENAYLKALVNEWKPLYAPEHRGSYQALLFLLMAALGLFGVARRGRKAGILEWALLAFALLLGLRAFRFLPYFALLTYPILVRSFGAPRDDEQRAHPRPRRRLLLAGAVPVLLLAVTLLRGPGLRPALPYPFRAELAQHPAAAMVERAKSLGRSGPVLNEYEIGAYLLYAAPELKPAIDARIDIYGPALVAEWQRALADPAAAAAYLDEHHMDTAMLYRSRTTLVDALLSGGWRVAFEDDTHVLLLRASRSRTL